MSTATLKSGYISEVYTDPNISGQDVKLQATRVDLNGNVFVNNVPYSSGTPGPATSMSDSFPFTNDSTTGLARTSTHTLEIISNSATVISFTAAGTALAPSTALTTVSGDLAINPAGSNISFSGKNLTSGANGAFVSLITPTVTTSSGDLSLNPTGSNININGKNVINGAALSLTSLTVPTITTASGDLSINPNGSSVSFNSKILTNVTEIDATLVNTPEIISTGDLILNPTGSIDLNAKNLISGGIGTFNAISTNNVITAAGTLHLIPSGTDIDFHTKNIVNGNDADFAFVSTNQIQRNYTRYNPVAPTPILLSATANCFVVIDASASTSDVQLPSVIAIGGGIEFTIKKIDASVNNVNVLPDGSDEIDGGAGIVLSAQYQWVTIVSDGTSNWWIISQT